MHSKILFKTLLIIEAKLGKSRIMMSITAFQIKLISRLIYVNQFYEV